MKSINDILSSRYRTIDERVNADVEKLLKTPSTKAKLNKLSEDFQREGLRTSPAIQYSNDTIGVIVIAKVTNQNKFLINGELVLHCTRSIDALKEYLIKAYEEEIVLCYEQKEHEKRAIQAEASTKLLNLINEVEIDPCLINTNVSSKYRDLKQSLIETSTVVEDEEYDLLVLRCAKRIRVGLLERASHKSDCYGYRHWTLN
jgi:hypothetical protein